MSDIDVKTAHAALQWYLDNGVDEVLEDQPINRFALKPLSPATFMPAPPRAASLLESVRAPILGKIDGRAEALNCASAANTLEELRQAIASFEGLAIRSTATNMVFSDGSPESPVMLVGEAPGGDEDRLGRPFVGASGQLLDKILKCIDLDRMQKDGTRSLYISNILNWRPPGNRTPSPAEIEISLPFIERHIALIKPKILILCGGVAAKALLGRGEGISRLRRTWHVYVPQTSEYRSGAVPIPAIATYHPAYLLRTPGQKRAVWTDMLAIEGKSRELGLRE